MMKRRIRVVVTESQILLVADHPAHCGEISHLLYTS